MTPLPDTGCLLSQSNNMCEKRTRRLKRGSHSTRLRENRRLQRIQWLASPPSTDDVRSPQIIPPLFVDKNLQKRVFLEIALKTVALMQKNKLIQQKIVALQKETSEFVTSILNNPENRKRYLDHLKLYGVPALPQINRENNAPQSRTVEVGPKA